MQQAATQPIDSSGEDDMASVYREHATRVLAAAYRVTGRVEDAEDVLQTVFMRLVRRQGGSGLTAEPGAYLHRAAINAGLDIVRSRRTAKATPLADVEGVLSGDETGPEQSADSAQMRERVRRAVAELNPRTAEIFALRYFQGYDNHEIARMLGTSRSSIGVILHRARQRVRESIEANNGEGQ